MNFRLEAKLAKELLQELFPGKKFSANQICKNIRHEGPVFTNLNRRMLISACKFMREANQSSTTN